MNIYLIDINDINICSDSEIYENENTFTASEGAQSFDALLVSPQKRLVIFHLVEGTNRADSLETQDYYFNVMESKLRTHKCLMDR